MTSKEFLNYLVEEHDCTEAINENNFRLIRNMPLSTKAIFKLPSEEEAKMDPSLICSICMSLKIKAPDKFEDIYEIMSNNI